MEIKSKYNGNTLEVDSALPACLRKTGISTACRGGFFYFISFKLPFNISRSEA